LLGDGDLEVCCADVGGKKNEEVFDRALSAGDSMGEVLDGLDVPSARVQGPLVLFSGTADKRGDPADGDWLGRCSCCSLA